MADTNRTIPCPKCDHLFYRNDLLQRHLNLRHGKNGNSGRKTRVSARAASPCAQDGINMQAHEDLNLLEDQSLPEMNLDVGLQSLDGAFQNGLLSQNNPGLDQPP